MKIPIDKVIVKERQRLDLGDVSDIATSFAAVGQIQPIGVNENNVLVWGRRRLEAAKQLGWSEIEAVQRIGLSPEMEQEIEYEEDARRKDRTWQEKCLAVYKLKRLKERRTGEAWSLRKMSDFTGIGKSSLGYMNQIAEGLLAEPRDEELWNCDNYLSAIKLLVRRTEQIVLAELERRRQAVAQVKGPLVEGEVPAEGFVQELDKTQPAGPTKVIVHGYPIAFKDAVPGEHFFPGRGTCIIGVGIEDWTNVVRLLDEAGFVIAFRSIGKPPGLIVQPWPLVWNKLAPFSSQWPFSPSYELGSVYTPSLPTGENIRSSVISCAPVDDFTLPASLVQHCIDGVLQGRNLPVYCIGGVRPVDVAQNGQVPIWYEPDRERYNEFLDELKAHYEETIPNVEVVVAS